MLALGIVGPAIAVVLIYLIARAERQLDSDPAPVSPRNTDALSSAGAGSESYELSPVRAYGRGPVEAEAETPAFDAWKRAA